MKNTLISLAWVGGGSMLGAILRYLTTLATQQYALTFPVGTLAVNWFGCLFIGFLAGLGAKTGVFTTEARLFLLTGFCGSLTTLSSLMYEIAQFIKSNEFWLAGLYFSLTFVGALGWFYGGVLLSALLLRP